MIKDGRPYTCERGHDDYELMTELPERYQKYLLEWIDDNISPAKRRNPRHSSYSLKHRFEHSEHGCYLTNNQFKDAMMAKGYMPTNQHDLNWQYKIKVAEKSNDLDALQRKLLPDQNEVLKNFVIGNFPDVHVQQKSKATNSYYYLVAEVEWHLCVLKQQYIITIWGHDNYRARKTIRLACLKKSRQYE